MRVLTCVGRGRGLEGGVAQHRGCAKQWLGAHMLQRAAVVSAAPCAMGCREQAAGHTWCGRPPVPGSPLGHGLTSKLESLTLSMTDLALRPSLAMSSARCSATSRSLPSRSCRLSSGLLGGGEAQRARCRGKSHALPQPASQPANQQGGTYTWQPLQVQATRQAAHVAGRQAGGQAGRQAGCLPANRCPRP